MAKMVLGKTPQELEAERAKKAREQEAEIQASILERQRKIQALHSKQKSNKIIIILIVFLIAGVLITFGTYNTFFKQGLTMDEVQSSINQSMSRLTYPSEGLDNFVRDNCDELFNHYLADSSAELKKNKIASIEVDNNSCYIYKVRKLSQSMAQVYFAVDVTTTEMDSEVTDQTLIEQLKRNGFGDLSTSDKAAPTTSPAAEPAPAAETVSNDTIPTEDPNTPAIDAVETTNDNQSTEAVTNEQAPTTEQAPADATPSEATTENSDIPNTSMDFQSANSGEIEHYYMTSGGAIMKEGKSTTYRYYFYMPVELEYLYSDGTNDGSGGGTLVSVGFKLAGEMTLSSQIETDNLNFDLITINKDYFGFNPELMLDEDTTNKIKIKVDKTLKDLYSYEDTSQDIHLYRKFNTSDASYVGIDAIEAYSECNYMGYNTYVTYTVTTSQGFKFQLHTYMKVEQNGDTWTITDIL